MLTKSWENKEKELAGVKEEVKEERSEERVGELEEVDNAKEVKEEVKSEVKVETWGSSEPLSPDIVRGKADLKTANFEEGITRHFSVQDVISVMARERGVMHEEVEKQRKEMKEEQRRNCKIVFSLLSTFTKASTIS